LEKIEDYMHQELYTIPGTVNLDGHKCFHDVNTYPNFQHELTEFKDKLVDCCKRYNAPFWYVNNAISVWEKN